MPAYSDDDYEDDEGPYEFHDEAEFDDYLNDEAVSYTHLDVYKRQIYCILRRD